MEAKEFLSVDRLKRETDRMIESMSHPAYVAAMQELKSTPNEKRLDVVMTRLTPEALREKGVPLPEGMRISSRYFDPGIPAVEAGQLPNGEKSVLRRLNEETPGILDQLRLDKPEAFDALAISDSNKPGIEPLAACLCACGGGGICGGLGGG